MLKKAILRTCLFATLCTSTLSEAASISAGSIDFDNATETFSVSNRGISGIFDLGAFDAYDPATGSLNSTTLNLDLELQGDLYSTGGPLISFERSTDFEFAIWVQNEAPPQGNLYGNPAFLDLDFDTAGFVIKSSSTSTSLLASFDLSSLNRRYDAGSTSHLVISTFGSPFLFGNANVDLTINGTAELIFDVNAPDVAAVPLPASIFFFLPIIGSFFGFRIRSARKKTKQV